MTEEEWTEAVKIMQAGMLKGARSYCINHTEVSGDVTILAERALRELNDKFVIMRRPHE